jgi:hypothetical protein
MPGQACAKYATDRQIRMLTREQKLDPTETPGPAISSLACCLPKRCRLGLMFDRRLPLFLARAILERMRLTKWRISKEPPDPPHSTPGE